MVLGALALHGIAPGKCGKVPDNVLRNEMSIVSIAHAIYISMLWAQLEIFHSEVFLRLLGIGGILQNLFEGLQFSSVEEAAPSALLMPGQWHVWLHF